MAQGALALSALLGLGAAHAAPLYNPVVTLPRRSDDCACTCAYLGGLCRPGAGDAACCQDLCCGANAEFPSVAEMAGGAAAGAGDGAPLRGMMLPEEGMGAVVSGKGLGGGGGEVYNQPVELTRRRPGCECACSYVGGMCRSSTRLSCCEEVCCGADVLFPFPRLAASRAMLQGSVIGPLTTAPATAAPAEAATVRAATQAPPATMAPAASTTTAAAAPCLERDAAWSPDMAAATEEPSAAACQERCGELDGCARFSFFAPTGACRLHDSLAVRTRGLEGFVSGPFMCWQDVDRRQFAKVDDQTFLPRAFGCMEPGVAWSPPMAPLAQLEGGRLAVAHGCRRLCESEDGCEHYTVTLPSTCHLSGAGAVKATGVAFALSGEPGGCIGAEGAADVVMKSAAWLLGLAPGAGARRAAAIAVAMASSAGIAAFAVASVVYRQRPDAREQRGRAPQRAGARLLEPEGDECAQE